MTIFQGRAATAAEYDLAEGVIWDDRDDVVRWVDIWKGRVLAGELVDDHITNIRETGLGETTGAIALTEDGGLLVAAARRLATISPAGDISFGPDLLAERKNVRFNDGSADLYGSFVVGTLTIGGNTGEEQLIRVSPNGRVETIREGIQLSNGVAFSPDGGTIYHVDTFALTVSRHSYGFGPFDLSEPWITVLDATHLPAYPDGLTVDATGALWVAQWGGSSVRRHAPTGELLDIVEVDAAQVSCPAFVGRDLDRLVISSAQEGLATITDRAGTIFLADVGTTGLRSHRWAGSTTTPYWLRSERENA